MELSNLLGETSLKRLIELLMYFFEIFGNFFKWPLCFIFMPLLISSQLLKQDFLVLRSEDHPLILFIIFIINCLFSCNLYMDLHWLHLYGWLFCSLQLFLWLDCSRLLVCSFYFFSRFLLFSTTTIGLSSSSESFLILWMMTVSCVGIGVGVPCCVEEAGRGCTSDSFV